MALHWEQATIMWAPHLSWRALELRVPASIRSHAAEILGRTLPPALQLLRRSQDCELNIQVKASQEVVYDDGSSAIEPGSITIASEDLTEVFEPAELRARLDSLEVEATTEGDAWVLRDEKRIEQFLQSLLDP